MPNRADPAPDDVICAAQENLLAYALLVSRGTYEAARLHRCIAWHLQEVEAGRIKRLWVRCPPQHGKSEIVSRVFPAWCLGRNPTCNILWATHTADLARDHGEAARDNIADPITRDAFPGVRIGKRSLREDANPEEGAALRFRLTAGGSFSAGGVRKKIPGKRAHIFIIDDPVGSAEEADSPATQRRVLTWYGTSVLTRLSPDGVIVGIDTSWGDGVLGSVITKEPGWHVLTLPAIREDSDAPPCCAHGDWRKPGEALWPERWPEHLMRAKAEELSAIVGPRAWQTLYQQRAVSLVGEIIKRAWTGNEYIEPPASFTRTIIYWDPKLSGKARGAHSSWAVGLVWGQDGARFYLLDRVRLQADFPIVLDAMRDLCARYPGAACYVEPTATGPAAVEVLRRDVPGVLLDEAVRGSKGERLASTAPTWEAGNVWLPCRRRSPWIDQYRENVVGFRDGSGNDDDADATSGALRVLLRAARSIAGLRIPDAGQPDWSRIG